MSESSLLAGAAAQALAAVRAGGDPRPALDLLARAALPELAAALPSHADRLAAWLNLYNVWARTATQPAHLRNGHTRARHYARRQFRLARRTVSLNDLEHGLLRRGGLWWGLGYLRHPAPPAWQRALRVAVLDPRIHFALNCGARSCPPIRIYQPHTVAEQLDAAAAAYLADHHQWAAATRTLSLPAVFRWYPGDFGGRAGILAFARRYLPALDVQAPVRLQALPWNWSPDTSVPIRDGS